MPKTYLRSHVVVRSAVEVIVAPLGKLVLAHSRLRAMVAEGRFGNALQELR